MSQGIHLSFGERDIVDARVIDSTSEVVAKSIAIPVSAAELRMPFVPSNVKVPA